MNLFRVSTDPQYTHGIADPSPPDASLYRAAERGTVSGHKNGCLSRAVRKKKGAAVGGDKTTAPAFP